MKPRLALATTLVTPSWLLILAQLALALQADYPNGADDGEQTRPRSPAYPLCTLGDDSFQIGERWNPNLPPFGVQVCVLCECTIRQRKSCYETKVTCRRITNECPIIESCPDGKRPATIAGQCCKSCHTAGTNTPTPLQSPVYLNQGEGQPQQSSTQDNHSQALDQRGLAPKNQTQTSSFPALSTPQPPVAPTTTQTAGPSLKIVYMNERTKDYLSMVKSLPACPAREGDKQAPSGNAAPSVRTAGSKMTGRNELNGIDSKLAFKSLHDVTTSSQFNQQARDRAANAINRSPAETTTVASNRTLSGTSDDQHPNDVQFNLGSVTRPNQSRATARDRNWRNFSTSNGEGQTTANQLNGSLSGGQQQAGLDSVNAAAPRQQSQNLCLLGNETFQIGDVWNPVLPPFGVQVCVQCNCIFRVRRNSCYEPKVVCKRINKDCPSIDTCPDGSAPAVVAGQCCKSCLQATDEQATGLEANVQTGVGASESGDGAQQAPQTPTTMTSFGMQRNEKIYRDFQTLSKSLSTCTRKDNSDGFGGNRYSSSQRRRRSR